MPRKTPHVVSTRLTYGQKTRLEKAAAAFSRPGEPFTVSDLLRGVIAHVARGHYDAAIMSVGMRAIDSNTRASERDRPDLCKFLGLPDDATDAEITDAVSALLGDGTPINGDARAGNANAPPAQSPFGLRRALSDAEIAYCRKHNISAHDFAARTRAAVRTAPKTKGK